jgi:predicted component of type VI protein secretion system
LVVEGRISHAFPLRGEVKLGREKGNTIVVADQKVSRHHATLTPLDENFIIQDQGSANGTYVNGVQIRQPTRLQDKDQIGMGDTRFLFTTKRPTPEAFPQSAAPKAGAVALLPSQPPGLPSLNSSTSMWVAIGCLAVALVALLILLALITGFFLGHGGLGLVLLWLPVLA